ncbi:hypothetical protein [Streptomyces sp. NBC_00076]|uniref:hypothetical protein n=1 Tax=Streptomyces sp. NBC_00076 TaxID=2975642 RepID=UPI00324DD52E
MGGEEAGSRRTQASQRAALADPGYQAFLILRTGFVVAPMLFGLDKFANLLVDRPTYLAPWINAAWALPVVGLAVALAPRFGGWLVAGWLAGIIVNLLTIPGHYDIALRDFAPLLGAVALARLAQRYHAKRQSH